MSKSASVTATATVEALDTTARTITLRDAKGQVDTYSVSPDVKRLNEFRIGDTVKMTYYESVVLRVRKPGDTGPAAGADVALSRGPGTLPGATLSVQDTVTVTVKAIDPALPSVTVTTSDGHTITRKVENKKNIEGLKAGDRIDITYTRAVLADLERAK